MQRLLLILTLLATSIQAEAEDLLTLYQIAQTHDPVLLQALARKTASVESKYQSYARFLPTIEARAQSDRSRLFNKKATFQGAGVQNFWVNTLAINLEQPVFRWENFVQLGQSENRIAQAEAEYLQERQRLMLRITEAYFDVLNAEDTVKFVDAERQAFAEQREQAERRMEVGVAPITDVYEAQAAYDRAVANQVVADNDLDDRKEALREIIGDFSGELAQLAQDLPLQPPEPNAIDDWSRAAERANYAVVAAVNQAEVARKNVELQVGGHLPQLDIVGNYNLTDNTSTFGLRGDSESIGLRVSLPIFSGGAVSSRIREAQQQFVEARHRLLEVQRRAIREVKDAFRGVNAAISQVRALEAAMRSAASALEASEVGFSVGTRTIVDVINERRDLFQAKRDYARARYDYLINLVRLKQAAGDMSEAELGAINALLAS
ncbi:MAG: TolC family outer membrane protein [Methylococcales bacterium]|nr:TolC family outer membrane protein [Methylococcales bacterium]